MQEVRRSLHKYFGPKCLNLACEGNFYYDASKCGIGYHGDGERRLVIGARCGASIPLHFNWWQKSEAVGSRCRILLNSGDMYAMSEKATGFDWKLRNKLTLRHAAGAYKYININGKV